MTTEKLIKIANTLEGLGFFKFASQIDKIAAAIQFKYTGDPEDYEEEYQDEEGDWRYAQGDEDVPEYADDDERHPYGTVYKSSMVQHLLVDMYGWERKLGELEYKKKAQGGWLDDKDYREHAQITGHLNNVTERLKEHFVPAIESWLEGHTNPQEWADRFLGVGKWDEDIDR